jgi:hypothetical protein
MKSFSTGVQMNPKMLPTVLMVIDVLAAFPCFCAGDWRRGVYWLAAATLTYTVTW